jgi:hypothetical protein
LARFLARLDKEYPGLGDVIRAWPGLDEPIRAGILSLAKAAKGRQRQ